MPILNDGKLLFVHIPKNAGKTIEYSFLNDFGRLGRRSPLNRFLTLASRLTASSDAKKFLHGTVDQALCSQHLTFQEIQLLNLVPNARLEAMVKFAVIRDPRSRSISSYRHFYPAEVPTADSFARFLSEWYDSPSADHNECAHKRSQRAFVVDCAGLVAIPNLLRFENLHLEFEVFCDAHGFSAPQLPEKRPTSADSLSDRLLNKRNKAQIETKFRDDFELYETS